MCVFFARESEANNGGVPGIIMMYQIHQDERPTSSVASRIRYMKTKLPGISYSGVVKKEKKRSSARWKRNGEFWIFSCLSCLALCGGSIEEARTFFELEQQITLLALCLL